MAAAQINFKMENLHASPGKVMENQPLKLFSSQLAE